MTDELPTPRFDVDWRGLDGPVFEAMVLAYRMASDREHGHELCPRRTCRAAGRCHGRPEERGDAPCAAPLTPYAWGHAKDHWLYARELLERIRPRRGS